MYDFLRGRLVESLPGRLVLDVGGVGFEVATPDHASEDVGPPGADVLLWTHLHFREDGLHLFGFVQRQERDLFRLLIKVSGVGPKLALQVLSGIRPPELIRAMADEDWRRLTLISGIGPKTARRLLIELKEKLTDQELQIASVGATPSDPLLSQAYQALLNLGFSPAAIRPVLQDLSPSEPDVPPARQLELIVKQALTKLTR